jgi:hypothetical protein
MKTPESNTQQMPATVALSRDVAGETRSCHRLQATPELDGYSFYFKHLIGKKGEFHMQESATDN